MMELLKLSESKAALVGGIAVDTLCFGSLVLLMLQPDMFSKGHGGVIVLAALAITAPVLAISAVAVSFALAGRFDVEERARRTLMSATVLHGGVQLSTVIGMMCGKFPLSLSSYFLSTLLVTTALTLSLLPISWVIKKLHKPIAAVSIDRPPPAKL